MPGRFSLFQDLTVEEKLKFFATIFGITMEENYNLTEDIYVQIEPFKDQRAAKLSGGMKQKLTLCCASTNQKYFFWMSQPLTLFRYRQRSFGNVKTFAEKGVTILVSTPYMDEAAYAIGSL